MIFITWELIEWNHWLDRRFSLELSSLIIFIDQVYNKIQWNYQSSLENCAVISMFCLAPTINTSIEFIKEGNRKCECSLEPIEWQYYCSCYLNYNERANMMYCKATVFFLLATKRQHFLVGSMALTLTLPNSENLPPLWRALFQRRRTRQLHHRRRRTPARHRIRHRWRLAINKSRWSTRRLSAWRSLSAAHFSSSTCWRLLDCITAEIDASSLKPADFSTLSVMLRMLRTSTALSLNLDPCLKKRRPFTYKRRRATAH